VPGVVVVAGAWVVVGAAVVGAAVVGAAVVGVAVVAGVWVVVGAAVVAGPGGVVAGSALLTGAWVVAGAAVVAGLVDVEVPAGATVPAMVVGASVPPLPPVRLGVLDREPDELPAALATEGAMGAEDISGATDSGRTSGDNVAASMIADRSAGTTSVVADGTTT
jgi:hypothetical protein